MSDHDLTANNQSDRQQRVPLKSEKMNNNDTGIDVDRVQDNENGNDANNESESAIGIGEGAAIIMSENIMYPLIAWTTLSTLYLAIKFLYYVGIAEPDFVYPAYDIRVFCLGCGLVSFVFGFSTKAWTPAATRTSMCVAQQHLVWDVLIPAWIWIHAGMYFTLSLCATDSIVANVYSSDGFLALWIFIVISNFMGTISFFSHRKCDKFAFIPFNEFCKGICFLLILTHV